MSKHTIVEFLGQVKVTISDREVRVWLCDETGCRLRLKAQGKVISTINRYPIHAQGNACSDVMIVAQAK